MTALSLSRAQARRIALAAQGFTDSPHRVPTMRTLSRAVARTGVLQVDSVNVLQRAHYLPLFSRMGSYDPDLLHRAASGREQRRLVEYWAHVQALMPVELWPVMRHRMDAYRERGSHWGFSADESSLREVLAAVRDRGASTARDLEAEFATGPRTKEHWGWNWSQARQALDFLYRCGDLAMAGRNSQFEVVYDLPERVLPTRVLDAPALTPQDAVTELTRRAARSHGVATGNCLADYYRMRLQPAPGKADVRTAIARLVEEGELLPVTVEGWRRPAYLHRDAARARQVSARALLSPFDPLVWERARTEALFDFRYRIEIYTPAAKRVHGYYVLPFLLGDQIVARVDLKRDRATGRLLVQSAFAEPGAPPQTAPELATELHRIADWLDMTEVVVQERGDLSPALGPAVRAASGRSVE